MMEIIFASIIGYLIGNISNAYLMGKILLRKDVREYGSGNAGATNALRAFGVKIGIAVFILDILKGILAVYIGRRLNPEAGQYFAGIFAIAGHNWPIMLKFKGGKGIATSIGVMLMINPFVSGICFIIGISLAFFTKIVSIGSIAGVVLAPVVVIFFKPLNINLLIFTLVLSGMAIYRHKENIKRLIEGRENKLGKKD
jgi:acyl phosphate:glycerol-3-phosphate acyltransferase